jgi:hypothetical protein
MTDCRAAVDEILARRNSRRNPGGIPGRQVSAQLSKLPAACRQEMRRVVEDILAKLPESDEGDLEPILTALAETGDDRVADLAAAALRNPFTMVKEDYASILSDLDADEQATEALSAVLRDGLTNVGRGDLTVTIRALRALQATEAIPLVADLLSHPDRAVRGVAAGFLYDLDDDGRVAAAKFAEQLAREDEAEVMEPLIDGLRLWHYPVDPELLAQLAEDTAAPESLRESARRAMPRDP